MTKNNRAAVNAALKLKSQLAVPASVTSKARAQSEADRWAKKRAWQNKASAKRAEILRERALEAGGEGWSTVESAVIDGAIVLPMIPEWYKPRRGPKKVVK